MPAESSKSEVGKPPRQATAECSIGALNSVATPGKKRKKKKKEKTTQSAGVKCSEKVVTKKTCAGKLLALFHSFKLHHPLSAYVQF